MTLKPMSILSRALALALLAAVCISAYAFVAQPIWARYESYRQSSVQSKELLAGYQRIGATAAALQTELIDLRSRQVVGGGYLAGASGSLAAAELQNHVKSIVSSAGAELRSTQILPLSDSGAVRRVGIRVQLPAQIGSLQRIAYALEGGKPYLFIDNVDIRRRKARKRAVAPEKEVDLEIRLDLYGYMQETEQ